MPLSSLQSAIPLAHFQHYQWLEASGGEQQWPVLRHRPSLPHAAVCHHVHCRLQVENEQESGLSYVFAVLCFPCCQCHAGGQNYCLPHYSLREGLWLTAGQTAEIKHNSTYWPLHKTNIYTLSLNMHTVEVCIATVHTQTYKFAPTHTHTVVDVS